MSAMDSCNDIAMLNGALKESRERKDDQKKRVQTAVARTVLRCGASSPISRNALGPDGRLLPVLAAKSHPPY